MLKLKLSFVSLFLACVFGFSPAAAAPAVPPLPSSFYGMVKVNGANVPTGTIVSAWINGVQYAWTTVTVYSGTTVYQLNVPGDQDGDSSIQGGVEGDTITFRVAGVTVAQTATWHTGTDVELNLGSYRAFVPMLSK